MKPQVPPLCAAVKRVRQAYGETLAEFAQRVRVSLNSISRFELGKAVPADFGVLNSLEFAARDRGLSDESRLFDEARMQVRWNAYRRPSPLAAETIAPVYSVQEWRLMQAARIAIRLYPEEARAMEKGAGPALALVDQILRSADAAVLGPGFYTDLEQRLTVLADRRALEALKKEGKE